MPSLPVLSTLISLAVCTALVVTTLRPAVAQEPAPPKSPTLYDDIPTVVEPAPQERYRAWRLYSESLFVWGVSVDLNRTERGLIVYPNLAFVVVLPEVGINVRTAGKRYVAVGASADTLIPSPLLRFSYGEQRKHSFFEVGVIAIPTSSRDGWDWLGPSVIPRVAFGTRF